MKRIYPYLESSYYLNSNIQKEQTDILKQIDSFVNQKQYVRITLLDWFENPLKEIQGDLINGTLSKDGTSCVRRTCSFSASLSRGAYSIEDLQMDFAINKKIFLEIGVKNYTSNYPDFPIFWFPQGVFFIGNLNISSNVNSPVNLSIQLKDKMCQLNGDVGGKLPATTILDTETTQDETGALVNKKVKISQIIQELVHHYGNEPINNIVIEDIPNRIKKVLKWTGDNPIWLVPKGNENQDRYYEIETERPEGVGYIINNNDDIGYAYNDFVYDTELTAQPGETVTQVLDKIKQYLGNYEYFYDIYGVFHFREIKNYLNTSQSTTLIREMDSSHYLVDNVVGKDVYTFSDDSNIINLNVNPQYQNIKNDYIIQGKRQGTQQNQAFPVIYHLAIDQKPIMGTAYENVLIYKEPKTGCKQIAFPRWVTNENELPSIGEFNTIYGLRNKMSLIDQNQNQAAIYSNEENDSSQESPDSPPIIATSKQKDLEKLLAQYQGKFNKGQLLLNHYNQYIYQPYDPTNQQDILDIFSQIQNRIFELNDEKTIKGISFEDFNEFINIFIQQKNIFINLCEGTIIQDDDEKEELKYQLLDINTFDINNTVEICLDSFYQLLVTQRDFMKNKIDKSYQNHLIDPAQEIISNKFVWPYEEEETNNFYILLQTCKDIDNLFQDSMKNHLKKLKEDIDKTKQRIEEVNLEVSHNTKSQILIELNSTMLNIQNIYNNINIPEDQKETDIIRSLQRLITYMNDNKSLYKDSQDILDAWEDCIQQQELIWKNEKMALKEQQARCMEILKSICDFIENRLFAPSGEETKEPPVMEIGPFVYWEDDVYKTIPMIKYYKGGRNDSYIAKDWRTELYIQGLKAKRNGIETNYYFPELEAFWPQTYDVENQYFYGETVLDLDNNTPEEVSLSALTNGNYFLDFIDSASSSFGKYSVKNIGRRTNVNTQNEVNCLFQPYIPDVVFLNIDGEGDLEKQRQECILKNQRYSQVKGNIYNAFATGGYKNGAFDQIKYDLYMHTHYQTSISLTALPVFYLEPNQRVQINDNTTNTKGSYVITNISIPLGAGSPMSITATQCLERF